MGILNVTPDSFSGDALGDDLEATLWRAEEMAESGVDLFDVGGESSRPGATPVTLEEELRRVLPVVKLLAGRFDIPISIDTYRAEVARQALERGASIVNDIWAMRQDPRMAEVVAAAGCWVVLMHNRRATARVDALGGHYPDVTYDDVVAETADWLDEAVRLAEQQGVARERIVLDPGLGFGKTYEQNLELIRRLSELKQLGLPLLVGVSRKSFTGRALGLSVDQRSETSLAALALCVAGGADVVRVHEVGPSKRAARMADEIVRRRPPRR
jgi:dihydropteroate synthase